MANFLLNRLSQVDGRFPPPAKTGKHREPFIAGLGALALSGFGEMAIPLLLLLLTDEDRILALNAAQALASIGEPALRPVIEVLRHQDKAYDAKRSCAVWALIHIGKLALEPLLSLLQSDDRQLRSKTAYILSEVTGKKFWFASQSRDRWAKWLRQNSHRLKAKRFNVLESMGGSEPHYGR